MSLLEILFTLGLLTVILVAFAAVYPSAYRLNRKSARATVAAKTCSAVAAEFLALPFDPPRTNPSQPNLAVMAQPGIGPVEVKKYLERQLRVTLPAGYRIKPEAVVVTLFPKPDPATLSTDTRFAQVQVTCYWTDANAAGLERSLTIVSGKAENRDVR